jgi:acyl-CoA thioesterase FadM
MKNNHYDYNGMVWYGKNFQFYLYGYIESYRTMELSYSLLLKNSYLLQSQMCMLQKMHTYNASHT